ncbi:MAG: SAM-dependent methyltransferase protein [Magnetococcales bacterium]|nr:SAM-dependent methyltransferase protein [Magnetococcales bacterium]HIJ83581.1 methyltransferase domain-containing protein [Magnetococcales bacterium]
MTTPFERKLYQAWEERWRDSQGLERLTGLGRLMFQAKKKVLRGVLPTLAPRSIIEVGCGLGHILEVYHQAGLDCVGIDISPSAIHICQKKGLRVELKNVDLETRSFDLVSSDGMLEHFLNFEPMARQMIRLSQRFVLLIQPDHSSFLGKTLPFLAELIKGDENVLEYNYRIGDFIDVFAQEGFEITINRPIFANVFRLLVFKRKGSI